MAEQDKTNHLPVDSTVVIAFLIDGKPMAVSCMVTSEAPLYLFTKDLRILDIPYPTSVVLVWHRGTDVMKGEAEAVGTMPFHKGNVIEIRRTNLQEVDRRLYPRYPVQIPISIRSISDVRATTVYAISQGTTKDLSLGGAWITVEPLLPQDTLVEFQCNVNGENVRALGLVVHENRENGTNGIEFIDFYDDSRDTLYKGLQRAA